eukprot:COSAG02_NODE_111_length_36009_cov_42.221248_9_plen_133_part_00
MRRGDGAHDCSTPARGQAGSSGLNDIDDDEAARTDLDVDEMMCVFALSSVGRGNRPMFRIFRVCLSESIACMYLEFQCRSLLTIEDPSDPDLGTTNGDRLASEADKHAQEVDGGVGERDFSKLMAAASITNQ